jgi:hypothetical protein
VGWADGEQCAGLTSVKQPVIRHVMALIQWGAQLLQGVECLAEVLKLNKS